MKIWSDYLALISADAAEYADALAAHCADEDFPELSLRCLQEEEAFYAAFRGYSFEKVRTPIGFMSRWEKKNKVFEEESIKSNEQ